MSYTLRWVRLVVVLLLEVVFFVADARATGFFVFVARVDVFLAVDALAVVFVVLFDAVVSCSPSEVAAVFFEDVVANRLGFAGVASDAPAGADEDVFLRVAR